MKQSIKEKNQKKNRFYRNLMTVGLLSGLVISGAPAFANTEATNTEASELGAEHKKEYILHFGTQKEKERFIETGLPVNDSYKLLPAVSVSLTNNELDEIKSKYNINSIEENQTFSLDARKFSILSEPVNLEYDYYNYKMLNTGGQSLKDGVSGKGVKVAIIDSGVEAHRELTIAGGASFVDYTTSYNDDQGHGTHVAGIVAAKHNSYATVGIAPDVELYAVKVMDSTGEGQLTDIIEGVEWAILNDMDIINLSLGTDGNSKTFENIINIAYENGILVVAASGNDSTRMENGYEAPVLYPAAYDNVIAVSAIDSNKNISNFASVGPEIDVTAPGVNIVSTYTGGRFAQANGTSQAAPHITGLLALLKEQYPNLTASEIRTKLERKAEDLGTSGFDNLYGHGLPKYSTKDISPPAEVTVLLASEIVSEGFTLSWTNPLEDFESVNIYLDDVKLAEGFNGYKHTFEKLLPDRDYKVTIKTVDQEGNESAGLSITVRTKKEALPNGWVNEGSTTYYYKEDGKKATGWQTIDNKKYYFYSSGGMAKGWLSLPNRKYYLGTDGLMVTGRQTIDGKSYTFSPTGELLPETNLGWVKDGTVTYYYKEDGTKATGFQTIDNKKYYFYSTGGMAKGWLPHRGGTYYLNTDGTMATGWQTIDNKKYYFYSTGGMANGWLTFSNNRKYYLNTDGTMRTGWLTIDNKTYYFYSTGGMATGWLYLPDNRQYFFNTDGTLVNNP